MDVMAENATEIREIISALEAAFAGVSRGAVTIHEAEVIDDYGSKDERNEARTRDPELDWRHIPDSSIEKCANALTYLDPVSWRFYLPAYVRFGLRWFHDPRGWIIDHAIYSLDPGKARTPADTRLDQFATLDAAQANVIRRFLEFASRNDAHCDAVVAKQALERYWSDLPR